MNIFEALRESHENQRNLSEQLIQTHGLTEERKELFDALKNELYAHSVAEDRYLYIPLMFDDVGLDITRHALSEHHEMDELVEQLEKTDMSSPS
ncbi:hemerythrin domain-containing protein, partial [Acinetobacter baumannii]|nr:hemerythrin domain-containing protein [Acinetobacter baumannii]